MVLSAAFIVPHGALILDALPSHKDGRYELHQAMIQVANNIAILNPDVILVTSPHGISLSNNFGIYINKSAQGTAEWEGEYQKYQIQVDIDLEFTEELHTYLQSNKQPISKITAYSQGVSIPLRWGESVPLWFLRNLPKSKYTFLSQPMNRYNPTSEFQDCAKVLGENIGNFINSHNKRVIVLISADLSHTHQKEGPYGYYKEAEKVDKLFEKWIGLNQTVLFTEDNLDILKKALCCGYSGFLMLQGILSTDSNFKGQLLVRSTPTYYGMMVASFLSET